MRNCCLLKLGSPPLRKKKLDKVFDLSLKLARQCTDFFCEQCFGQWHRFAPFFQMMLGLYWADYSCELSMVRCLLCY